MCKYKLTELEGGGEYKQIGPAVESGRLCGKSKLKGGIMGFLEKVASPQQCEALLVKDVGSLATVGTKTVEDAFRSNKASWDIVASSPKIAQYPTGCVIAGETLYALATQTHDASGSSIECRGVESRIMGEGLRIYIYRRRPDGEDYMFPFVIYRLSPETFSYWWAGME